MLVLILERPSRRSTKVIGTSAMRAPRWWKSVRERDPPGVAPSSHLAEGHVRRKSVRMQENRLVRSRTASG